MECKTCIFRACNQGNIKVIANVTQPCSLRLFDRLQVFPICSYIFQTADNVLINIHVLKMLSSFYRHSFLILFMY